MNLSAVQDFYLMEALWSQRHVLPEKKATDKWIEDAEVWYTKLNHDLALAIRDYLFMAACGEARHSPNKRARKQYIPEIKKFTGGSRSAVYNYVRKFDPSINAQQLADLFHEEGWESSMGGPKWGMIADAIVFYDKWGNDVTFIDHAIDLEHNGGTAFSKPTDSYQDFRTGSGTFWQFFRKFLDYKATENIINNKVDTNWLANKYGIAAPYRNLGNKTLQLFKRFLTIQRHVLPPYLLEVGIAPIGQVTYKPTNWGEGKFSPTEAGGKADGSEENPYDPDCCGSCQADWEAWEADNNDEKEQTDGQESEEESPVVEEDEENVEGIGVSKMSPPRK